MTLGKPLGNLGTEGWFLGTNLVIKGLELSVPPLTSRKGGGAEVSILSPMANDLINLTFINKTSKKTLKGWVPVQRASRLMNTWRRRVSGTLREHGNSMPFPQTLLCHVFHLAVSELYHFIINWSSRK